MVYNLHSTLRGMHDPGSQLFHSILFAHTEHPMKRLILLTLSLLFIAACGTVEIGDNDAEVRGEELTRSEAEAQLEAGVLNYDPCEEYGWYGDGTCDEFCPLPDPSCDDDGDQNSTDPAPPECTSDADCFVGGCSSQLCSAEQGMASTCEWLEEYACYQDANLTSCGCFEGSCGWDQTEALEQCVEGSGDNGTDPVDPVDPTDPTDPDPGEEPGDECTSAADCFVGGCSGQLCSAEEGMASTCEWIEEYACFQDANITSCGCFNGYCGWDQTPELAQCLGD